MLWAVIDSEQNGAESGKSISLHFYLPASQSGCREYYTGKLTCEASAHRVLKGEITLIVIEGHSSRRKDATVALGLQLL